MSRESISNLTRGIIRENPIFVMLLGMCPTLGVSTSATNGLGMGLATMFVLILSNVFTGCKRTIRFCLIAYAQGFYYVKELMSGHSYKTKKLHYADMEIGTHYGNFTAIEGKNHQLAVQID